MAVSKPAEQDIFWYGYEDSDKNASVGSCLTWIILEKPNEIRNWTTFINKPQEFSFLCKSTVKGLR
jgi:hypothetical protein